jgi:hypothetical protein
MNLEIGDTQAIIAEGRRRGVLRNQLAYILATAYHESGHTMKPIEEMGGDKYLRSKKYYPWYGRGYVQITWEDNYKKYGITNAADALKPEVAMHVLFDGMLNGVFTGRRLDRYVNLKESNFPSARQVVNKLDQYTLIAGYAKEYDKQLKTLGYGEGTVEPTVNDNVDSTAIVLLKLILKLITEYLAGRK